MIQSSAIIDTDVLQAVSEMLAKAPETARKTINRLVIPETREKAAALLGQEPGPVKRPIQWQSEKQRRAYFASNGFGGGIPYRRTGKMLKAWKVYSKPLDAGLEVSVSNSDPKAVYVIGNRQQIFHANTGWYKADERVIELSEFLNARLIDAWYSAIDFTSVLP